MKSMFSALLTSLILVGVSTTVNAIGGPVYFPKSSPAPYSKAVQVDNTLYISGLLGTGKDGLSNDFTIQATQVMDNLTATLSDFNLTTADVFKCVVMIDDMDKWPEFNKIYVSYFQPERLPVRSAFGSNGLPMNAFVELECQAYLPESKK